MAFRRLSALAFLALAACPREDVPLVPMERTPRLDPGAYELVVDDVIDAACPGVSPRDLVGARIAGELSFSRRAARLALPGWVLRGDVEGRNLFVEGAAGAAPPTEPEPVDDEAPGEDAGPVAGGEDAAEADAPAGDEPDCVEPDGPEGVDCGDERPSGPPLGYASFDAEIMDAGLARGELVLAAEGCELVLDARLVRAEARPEPPIYEEPAPGEGSDGADEGDAADGAAPAPRES